MHRVVAIVLAVLMGFTAPVLAQTGNASASGQNADLLSSQSRTDGNSAMAQAQEDNTPSPLLIGGLALAGAGALVWILVTHKSKSP